MCRLSGNLGASTFGNLHGVSRTLMGLLYLLLKNLTLLRFGGKISCFMHKVQNILLITDKAMTIPQYVDLIFSNVMFSFQ